LAASTSLGESNITKILTTLNEVGSTINRSGSGGDLPATLQLIVDNAVKVVAACGSPAGPKPRIAAVLWGYNSTQQDFVRGMRASAGEPANAAGDDFPRADGLGKRSILHARRVLSYEEADFTLHPATNEAGAQSVGCFPLIVMEEPVGVLYIFRFDEYLFDPLILLGLDNFANLVAMAMYSARRAGEIARRLERQVKELEKLRWASQVISSRTTLQETLREILEIGLAMTAAQYGSFELYDKENQVLTIEALAGRTDSVVNTPPLPVDENSVVGWVASRKEPLLIPDLDESRWLAIYHPLPTNQKMRSELAVPLLSSGDNLEGVLNIESPRPHAFSEEDQRLLEALASQAVIALQEIRLLNAIQEITDRMRDDEEDKLLKFILDQACALVNLPLGAIWTISGTNLILRQSTEGCCRNMELPLNGSLTGQAIRLRRAIAVDNIQNQLYVKNQEIATNQSLLSAIVVPLLTSGESRRALGSFSLYSKHPRDFSDWDRKVLTSLADQAAIALQHAADVARLKELNDLSEREHEVLTFLTQGYTNKQIANALTVSVNTIKKHVQNIFAKLNVDSRAAAVAKALGQD